MQRREPPKPYVYCQFPKWVEPPGGEPVIVQSAEEEARVMERARVTQPAPERRRTVPNRDAGRAKANAAQATSARAFAAGIMPAIAAIQAKGITSLDGIAKALNEYGIASRRGGKWQASQVRRIVVRIES